MAGDRGRARRRGAAGAPRGAGARERLRVRPTARGVALVLVGAALAVGAYWERQIVLLVPAALCLAVVVLGVWWAAGAVGQVRLRVPGVIAEGEDAWLSIASERPQAGARWETWGPGPERYLLLEGELDDEGRAELPLGDHPRGRWRLAPVAITAFDPFRVARSARTIDPGASLVVGPEIVTIPPTALRSDREQGRVAQSRTADDVDAMVREWRHGDPQRRVHWRQTAKRGYLMVRQEANPASDDDIVVVDTAGAADLDRDAHDRLARAACSIVRALAGGDRRVVVRETGEPSIAAADWRDRAAALAAFASMEAVAPVEEGEGTREPGDEHRSRERSERTSPLNATAHVVALEEAAPETWRLAPGSTLWLVARADAPPRSSASASRVRVQRWIDHRGPVRELV
ncbi:DUF58 domain-containing protein [Agrococcus carbonis]|uniref:Uncharacterized conserved protein, DUF58 family, contains vWF domain n=1 Tax=Agrococcus carbonis TaxID=684552 RepID=A0A1H1RYX1_9MICO|nr:DUF58 domain-containing protein [Agrococcus carbonis]SDS40951.1 Uncharacterized conserved protein, DUF58 family, contains vWF domain [Agrococcus carbonis]